MKNKKIKNILKIFAFAFVIIVGMQIFYNVNAAINKNYGDQTESTDVDLDKKIKSSTLLDYIGAFIYAIGNIAESVTSGIMGLAGSGNIFPWADKVIFNTIPILDVNFINPDANSLLATGSNSIGIGEVIRNIYFSGLSIALGFFGIIIAILAIKLAISTIGSDKAKYKEAMTKWITALVLLFGMHFVLSFLFFLNENLVEVASLMLEDQTTKYAAKIQEKMQELSDQNSDQILDNFMKKAWDSVVKNWNLSWPETKKTMEDAAKNIEKITDGNIFEKIGGCFSYGWDTLKMTFGNGDPFGAINFYNDMLSLENLISQNKEIAYGLISNATIESEVLNLIQGNPEKAKWTTRAGTWITDGTIFNGFKSSRAEQIRDIYALIYSCAKGAVHDEVQEVINNKNKTLKELTDNAEDDVIKIAYTTTYNYQKYGTANASYGKNVISTLGEYFKKAAWYVNIDEGGWAPDQVSIIAAILYTMFVFQSISFFLAYIKRFFYVVILAVLAPFVVLYDFLGKSVSL